MIPIEGCSSVCFFFDNILHGFYYAAFDILESNTLRPYIYHISFAETELYDSLHIYKDQRIELFH